MKRTTLAILATLLCALATPTASAQNAPSPTEGFITHDFVGEKEMKADLLQMLANFSRYMVADWNPCQEPNNLGEACGFFKGENSGGSDERGVRPNADLSMVCAFLVKYGRPADVALPDGVTWEKLEEMARHSLIFAYSTHKANRLKVCAGGRYWGSTSKEDFAWESSLWAMSVAYSAFFQWDTLSEEQRDYIYRMLRAECNYELERDIPTGYQGDTKAEENGWEADILAATLGLFPNDSLATRWFERLRLFAINSYSHPSDSVCQRVIDPHYDQTTVADLYKGQNLYNDYTLQNHNLFHTSYQNVVMQELGEAALALKMFQKELHGKETWRTNALMHHNQEVQDSVLNWLALADGELAMPNGNDWSLFLFDQITSYTTQACFQHDANALMMENMAYKYIKARQQTTPDGSWLLRADVGARRMGVEAHRVMMTYLMHDVLSTAKMKPSTWTDFNKTYGEARILPCQNVVRAATDSRFTTFSWSEGLKSYTGYIAANSPDKNKIVVPFRANNTGNILGWYEVNGKKTDAVPVVKGNYQLMGNAYVMNGELTTNGGTLDNRFAIYSTPGNAVIYMNEVTAKEDCTVKEKKDGLLAISVDEMTVPIRTLYYSEPQSGETPTDEVPITSLQTDGSKFQSLSTTGWVNIDNEVGIATGMPQGKIAFGDRRNNNSILTALLYPMYQYHEAPMEVKEGELVASNNIVYYSNISSEETRHMRQGIAYWGATPMSDKPRAPHGWGATLVPDPDGSLYLLASNFRGEEKVALQLDYMGKAPVLAQPTNIHGSKATVTLHTEQNSSVAQPILALIEGNNVVAQVKGEELHILATENTEVVVWTKDIVRTIKLRKGKAKVVKL